MASNLLNGSFLIWIMIMLIFLYLLTSQRNEPVRLNYTNMQFASDTIKPSRGRDSLYISVKDGKWIQEGPITKVTGKYGGFPPLIPEVTKCYPCHTDTALVKD